MIRSSTSFVKFEISGKWSLYICIYTVKLYQSVLFVNNFGYICKSYHVHNQNNAQCAKISSGRKIWKEAKTRSIVFLFFFFSFHASLQVFWCAPEGNEKWEISFKLSGKQKQFLINTWMTKKTGSKQKKTSLCLSLCYRQCTFINNHNTFRGFILFFLERHALSLFTWLKNKYKPYKNSSMQKPKLHDTSIHIKTSQTKSW